MALEVYPFTVPSSVHMLNALQKILVKAAAFSEQKKIAADVLPAARLAPDMFPLSRQVQIACDMVKNGAARLAQVEIPSFADTETTLPELIARVEKTVAFLEGIAPEAFAGAQTRTVSFKVAGQDMQFVGDVYLRDFVLPNFYFHLTAAYLILRHNGVDIGKWDFLGRN